MVLRKNYSKVQLKTTKEMILDNSGLIHGGFIFSLADYAAMLAINHPFVVLGGANVRFLLPVKIGDIIIAESKVAQIKGKKHIVDVIIQRNTDIIFKGEFYCFIPQKHILERN
ncbi:MAG: hotdog domain-containing protein [Promethearchaeota archaeon]